MKELTMSELNTTNNDTFKLGDRTFKSRLIIGTGKYSTFELMQQCLEASGAEIVTVALRRVNLENKTEKNLLDYIDTSKYIILPNTAGCYSMEEAIRVAHLARALGMCEMIKLEVIGDEKTLMPDPIATLEAAKILVKENYFVMPYITDDPIMCKKLQEVGCPVIMPIGSPIGSGQGILNKTNLRIIMEQAKVPVIVDAGVGTASDAAVAMEMGADAVLMNTAIAGAGDPLKMAIAMRKSVEAGRLSFQAGRIPKKLYANASSPLKDF
jgi:thiazole synthase